MLEYMFGINNEKGELIVDDLMIMVDQNEVLQEMIIKKLEEEIIESGVKVNVVKTKEMRIIDRKIMKVKQRKEIQSRSISTDIW